MSRPCEIASMTFAADGPDVPPCDATATHEVRGHAVCAGCADYVRHVLSLGLRVVDRHPRGDEEAAP